MDEQYHILIADDDPGIQASLSAFLTRAGFEVSVARDGEEALVQVDTKRPDLVLLDVLMPRLDGRAALRRLRRAGDWTPVILLTEVGGATERAMALDEGADDYINKPFEGHELVARIRAVLRRARQDVPPLSAAWVLESGALRLDRRARRVSLNGRDLEPNAQGSDPAGIPDDPPRRADQPRAPAGRRMGLGTCHRHPRRGCAHCRATARSWG